MLSLMLTACDKPQTAEQQSTQEIKQVAQVKAPTEMKSTPVFAKLRMVSLFIPPELSVSYFPPILCIYS